MQQVSILILTNKQVNKLNKYPMKK